MFLVLFHLSSSELEEDSEADSSELPELSSEPEVELVSSLSEPDTAATESLPVAADFFSLETAAATESLPVTAESLPVLPLPVAAESLPATATDTTATTNASNLEGHRSEGVGCKYYSFHY